MVSVVIPVYKTEKYLNSCVESVVNQTYRNLEILLIDDGSPDGCPGWCDAWAKRDRRISVIHKRNEGLGMARNTGIQHAAGQYICFLDSDDFLAPEAIAYARAAAQHADLMVYGFVSVSEGGSVLSSRVPKAAEYRGSEVRERFLSKFLAGEDGLQMSACWALFSMDAVRRAAWQFPSEKEILSEDVYALLGLFRHVESVTVLDKALYYYRGNPSSLTRTYRGDRFERIKDFYRSCVELCWECGYSGEITQMCREPFLSFTIAALKQETDGSRIREILMDPLLQQLLRERRGEKTGLKRRLLFSAMERKQYFLCRLMLTAQRRRDAGR